jgi:hypothetical protein
MDRRRFLTSSGLALALAPTLAASRGEAGNLRSSRVSGTRVEGFKHSICRW